MKSQAPQNLIAQFQSDAINEGVLKFDPQTPYFLVNKMESSLTSNRIIFLINKAINV